MINKETIKKQNERDFNIIKKKKNEITEIEQKIKQRLHKQELEHLYGPKIVWQSTPNDFAEIIRLLTAHKIITTIDGKQNLDYITAEFCKILCFKSERKGKKEFISKSSILQYIRRQSIKDAMQENELHISFLKDKLQLSLTRISRTTATIMRNIRDH